MALGAGDGTERLGVGRDRGPAVVVVYTYTTPIQITRHRSSYTSTRRAFPGTGALADVLPAQIGRHRP